MKKPEQHKPQESNWKRNMNKGAKPKKEKILTSKKNIHGKPQKHKAINGKRDKKQNSYWSKTQSCKDEKKWLENLAFMTATPTVKSKRSFDASLYNHFPIRCLYHSFPIGILNIYTFIHKD